MLNNWIWKLEKNPVLLTKYQVFRGIKLQNEQARMKLINGTFLQNT